MRKLFLNFIVVLGVCLAAGTARADSFNLLFTANGQTVSTVLTGSYLLPGVFEVTGATDSGGSATVTGISTFNLADNILFPTGPYVDLAGLSFGTVQFGDANLYYTGTNYFVTGLQFGTLAVDSINVTLIEPTPEPSSLVLLGSGLLGGIGVLRRRVRA